LEILFNWRLEGHGEISIKHRKESLKAGQALQLLEALMLVSEERERVHLKRKRRWKGQRGSFQWAWWECRAWRGYTRRGTYRLYTYEGASFHYNL
jgi:hypothetical protein